MQVELAFQEAKADVTRYWIDLKNKPEWFASRVNPVGKVR
jgi:glutathione S-transferase